MTIRIILLTTILSLVSTVIGVSIYYSYHYSFAQSESDIDCLHLTPKLANKVSTISNKLITKAKSMDLSKSIIYLSETTSNLHKLKTKNALAGDIDDVQSTHCVIQKLMMTIDGITIDMTKKRVQDEQKKTYHKITRPSTKNYITQAPKKVQKTHTTIVSKSNDVNKTTKTVNMTQKKVDSNTKNINHNTVQKNSQQIEEFVQQMGITINIDMPADNTVGL